MSAYNIVLHVLALVGAVYLVGEMAGFAIGLLIRLSRAARRWRDRR